MNYDVELCAALGPAPFPGARPYACSLSTEHRGVHEAWVDGQFLDSWPRREAP